MMNRNFLKALISLVLLAVMISSTALEAFALPINSDIADNYLYSYYGEAVQAPQAYKPVKSLGYVDLGLDKDFQPNDLYVRGSYLYIVDKGGNRVIVLDEDYKIVSIVRELKNSPDLYTWVIDANGERQLDQEMMSHSKNALSSPEGIYVDEEGLLYICDTQNRRIVICDINGNVSKVIQGVNVKVIDEYVFKPVKVVVDRTGTLEVIAYAVNRGLLEIDNDGVFRSFFGAPPVTYDMTDWFWRLIATDEQKKKLVKYVPTEYSNITMDDRGFIYSTISTIDSMDLMSAANSGNAADVSGAIAPVKKLSPSGSDVLRRTGTFAPIGDINFTRATSPQIVDVAVDSNSGRYTILDQRMGRFFTYDADGNLLYMGGGTSTDQNGRFKTANSIAIRGEHIIISDIGNKCLTVYETTEYAKLINSAVTANSSGLFDEAAELWKQVTTYNSTMYIAYIGLGKAEMRQAMSSYDDTRFDNYETALVYYAKANEKTNYSKAYKELRKDELSKNFTLIVVSIVVLVVGLVVLFYVRKAMKNKKTRQKRGAK